MVLSSLIFALMHLPNLVTSHLSGWQSLTALCSLFLLGMALAIGFVRTGSTLWFPWALHFAHNLVFGFQGVFFQIDHQGPSWWAGIAEWAPESGVLGLLFGVTLVLWSYGGLPGPEAHVTFRDTERRGNENDTPMTLWQEPYPALRNPDAQTSTKERKPSTDKARYLLNPGMLFVVAMPSQASPHHQAQDGSRRGNL